MEGKTRGNGLEAAQTSVVSFEPCATDDKAFNYELQRPITEELYELLNHLVILTRNLEINVLVKFT